jgi:putative oxidoreductase
MKRFCSTAINPYFLNLSILIVRILIGLTMLTHGTPKLMKFMGDGPMSFGDPLNIGPGPSLVLTVFAEVICAVLIILGLFTRPATIPLMITMAVAAFIVHKADGFAKQEMAMLYLIVFFVLFTTGGGKYSVDRWLERK